ncbi:MAG TPA: hypothetical protein VN042_04820 [Asticcacaulis sp.]|nr:hypothetical protein [Asticcacaulis sp.]
MRVSRPKRLRNTLVSVLICAGLMAAYYVSLGQAPIPPDTRIIYEALDCGGPCPAFRLEISADGAVSLRDASHIWRYRMSQFALRRILRAFDQTQFLSRDVNADLPRHPPVCDLSLRENHRFLALRHGCGAQAPEMAAPVAALEQVTQFRKILAGDAGVMRAYHIETSQAS